MPLSREEAWHALNDPDILAASVPGCESLEKISDTEFRAMVRTSIGPVKAQFKGKVTLSNMTPPESYTLTFKGDGSAGFVQGSADVRLTPALSGAGTTIAYEAQAKIGGKLAQIGSRLVDGAAKKMADEFFTNLTTQLGGTPKPARAAASEENGNGGLWIAILRFFSRLIGKRNV